MPRLTATLFDDITPDGPACPTCGRPILVVWPETVASLRTTVDTDPVTRATALAAVIAGHCVVYRRTTKTRDDWFVWNAGRITGQADHDSVLHTVHACGRIWPPAPTTTEEIHMPETADF